MMNCYSLFVGCRPGKKRFLPADDRALRSITARYFPNGLTILTANGEWYDKEKRRFKKEEARQILICASDRKKIPAWCNELGRALRQKELLVVALGTAKSFTVPVRE